MIDHILIGVKEGLEHGPLFGLAREITEPPAKVHLLTLLRVGTNEDEVHRLGQAKQHLEEQATPLRDAGYTVSCETGLITVGAASQVLQAAESRGINLLLIGLAKRTRVGKALLGSDAQRILLGSTCPVLTVQLQPLD